MGRFIKYLLLVVLALIIPIKFAVYFSDNSKNSGESSFYQRASLRSELDQEVNLPQSQAEDQDNKNDFLTINSDINLDPSPDNFFIVSTYIKIDELPKLGRRQKIIGKYLDKKPSSGWALGIKRLSTSVRPEIYFQGEDSEVSGSGWYTFEKVKFKRKHWYAITVVFKKAEAVSLFLEEIADPSIFKLNTENNDTDIIPVAEANEQHDPIFLGGYDFSKVMFKSTDANMVFAPMEVENGEFKGELADLLIINTKELNFSENELSKIIKGGPQKLAGNFNPESVVFWATKEGDKSRFQRSFQKNQKNT